MTGNVTIVAILLFIQDLVAEGYTTARIANLNAKKFQLVY